MSRCRKCGAKLPQEAKFCNICGTAVEDTEQAGADVQENATAQQASDQQFGAGAQASDQQFGAGAQASDQQFGAGAQANAGQQFGAGAQMNGDQQFGAGAQANAGQQFGAGAQANADQQFGAGAQANAGQQFGAGAQMNGNQQFGAGAQMNGNQQFGNGQQFQQAPPKEGAAAYYAKMPYTPPADDAQANKGVAICAYFGLFWLVPLLTTAKHSPFAKFHTNQAILVFLTSVVVKAVIWVLSKLLTAITWRMYAVTGFLSFAGSVFCLVLMIVGIVYAAQGKMKELPVIGQFHLLK